jgi:hypothetical protein
MMKARREMGRMTMKLVIVFLVSSTGLVPAADEWQTVEGPAGKVSVMIPTPVATKVTEKKTLAGTLKTTVRKWDGSTVAYDFSFTEVPEIALKVAGAEKIIENAKGNVLSRAFGKEISFEEATFDGQKAQHLVYETAHLEDDTHPGFNGEAYLFVLDGVLYVVNVMIESDAEKADMEKFLGSMKIGG